jgi:hypothetical protein
MVEQYAPNVVVSRSAPNVVFFQPNQWPLFAQWRVKSKGVYKRLFTERIEIAHAKLHSNMFVQRSLIADPQQPADVATITG